MCINCFVGYFPNKLANNTMLYFLDTYTYNLYIAFSNGLIWFSHGIKIFIHLIFNDEFYDAFLIMFRNKKPTMSRTSASATGMSVLT